MFKILTPALCLLLAFPLMAAPKVLPKRGDVQLYADKDESREVCKFHNGTTAKILKDDDDSVLLKADSCQGWAKKAVLEYAPDKSEPPVQLESVEICDWVECMVPKEFWADSFALYYNDSTLFSPSIDFNARLNQVRDSLEQYYILHPESVIEHRDFFDRYIARFAYNVRFARMEWNHLDKRFFLMHQTQFDSVYKANRSRYLDSLKHVPKELRQGIRLSMLEYEMEDSAFAAKKIENEEEMQLIADSISDGDVSKKINIMQTYKIPQPRKFLFGVSLYGTHLMGKNASRHGEIVGGEGFFGGPSIFGFSALYLSIGAGMNSGEKFTAKNEVTYEKKDFMVSIDIGYLIMPVIPFKSDWTIQPEIGVGGGVHLADAIFYSTWGVRFWKKEPGWKGLAKWSAGASVKVDYLHLRAVKLDIRRSFFI